MGSGGVVGCHLRYTLEDGYLVIEEKGVGTTHQDNLVASPLCEGYVYIQKLALSSAKSALSMIRGIVYIV